MEIISVSPAEPEVQRLIAELDTYQIKLYGQECCHLDSADELVDSGAHMLGAYVDEILVGIGAIKLRGSYAEIKRVYFIEEYRGRGFALELVRQLELFASDNKCPRIKLETGYLQGAAMQFYTKLGYVECLAFGEYSDNGISVFMEKPLFGLVEI